MNVYTLAENYDCMQMVKFVCSYSVLYLYRERFIWFPIDFSSPNCFSISEPISLMTRSFMLSLTLRSPTSPLYSIPWALRWPARLSPRRSRMEYERPSQSTEFVLSGVKSSFVKFPPIGTNLKMWAIARHGRNESDNLTKSGQAILNRLHHSLPSLQLARARAYLLIRIGTR